MLQSLRFLCTIVLWLGGLLVTGSSALGQSTLDALMAAVDTNNVYLKAGRRCLDSCRTVKLGSKFARQLTDAWPSLYLMRQNRRLTEKEFEVLRQKVYRQVSLTCIDLIYQRKRQRELTQRQAQIRQFAHDMLLLNLSKSGNPYELTLSSLSREITGKLLYKQTLIEQHQNELFKLMGNREIAFSDTVYPPISRKKVMLKHTKQLDRFDAEHNEWRNRFVLLQQLLELDSTGTLRRKPFQVIHWEFKNGLVTADELVSHLINQYRLTDAQMRTERDLHIAAVYLLAYTKKAVR